MNKIAASICILGACVAISGMQGQKELVGIQAGAAVVALVLALIMGVVGQDPKSVK